MNPGDRVQVWNPRLGYHGQFGTLDSYTTDGLVIVALDCAHPDAYHTVAFYPWDIQPAEDQESE